MGAQFAQGRQILALTGLAYLAAWTAFFIASDHERRQNLIRFVAFNLAVAIALVIVEVSTLAGLADFRLVYGRPLDPWENPKNLLDPDLIHIHRPHFEEVGQMQGGDLQGWAAAPALTLGEYRIRYDHNGFRNEADPQSADVIVIGDSYVEAANVLPHELLTSQLAKELGVNVVNLGQSSYGPQQELHVLRRFGVPLRPKVCVWVFFEGNDLSDVRHYEKMRSSWPQVVATYSSWFERSFLKNTVQAMGAWVTPRATKSSLVGSGILNHGADSSTRLWFGYPGVELSPADHQSLSIVKETLSEAWTICQQNEIELFVVFAPTKYRVYGEGCQFSGESYINNWVRNDLPERLQFIVGEICGVERFVDLTHALQDTVQGEDVAYYPDDSHWSPAGHHLATKVISNAILAAGQHLKSKE